MKIYLLVSFMLSTCLIIEAADHMANGLRSHDTDDQEIIYRVTRGIQGKRKDGECRYKKGPWSDCDSSNMQRKTLTLKRGDTSCEQTKSISRKCKKACKYDKGDWTDCETNTNTRVRTDSLKPKSDSSCQPTRTLSKKCKKVCKYNKQGLWSECDSTTGKKTKVLSLKSGDPQVCEASKKITKPCPKGSGHGGHKANRKGKQDDYDEDE